jgi:hypothetical protein
MLSLVPSPVGHFGFRNMRPFWLAKKKNLRCIKMNDT